MPVICDVCGERWVWWREEEKDRQREGGKSGTFKKSGRNEATGRAPVEPISAGTTPADCEVVRAEAHGTCDSHSHLAQALASRIDWLLLPACPNRTRPRLSRGESRHVAFSISNRLLREGEGGQARCFWKNLSWEGSLPR